MKRTKDQILVAIIIQLNYLQILMKFQDNSAMIKEKSI